MFEVSIAGRCYEQLNDIKKVLLDSVPRQMVCMIPGDHSQTCSLPFLLNIIFRIASTFFITARYDFKLICQNGTIYWIRKIVNLSD